MYLFMASSVTKLNGLAKITNLMHTSQSVYSMWLWNMCKASIWEKAFLLLKQIKDQASKNLLKTLTKVDKYPKTLNSSFDV